MSDPALIYAAECLRRAERVAVLTGAGVSAESGVPVFRGAGGLWREFRPEDLATPAAFARAPALVWEWYLWRREKIAAARPNAAHEVIARLVNARGATLLTQNVDGLHQRAGAAHAVELHGNLWRARCSRGCGAAVVTDAHDAPPRAAFHCGCGAWLRPDVVWFGEPLDAPTLDAAEDAVTSADLVLVVGTSAVVYPVAALPTLARARVVEINPEDTPLSPHVAAVIRQPAAAAMAALEARG